jgi:biopolymer transport protein ExbD
MARALWIKRVAGVAVGVIFLFSLLQCSRSGGNSSNQQPLDVRVLRDGSIEADGHRFEEAKEFEAYLRKRRPSTVHVRPATDATYEGVNGAMKAIQNVGDIDIGVVGNEKF